MNVIIKSICALLLCATMFTPAYAATDKPYTEEPAGVTWEELDERIREGSLNALALGESIDRIEAVDYEKMYDALRDQMNEIAGAQWAMVTNGNNAGADSLQQIYDALRDTFDDIKDGKLQQDNTDNIRQMKNAVNQTNIAGQTLYLNLLSMEQSKIDGQRTLATLDRSLKELCLLQTLGRTSAQSVADLELKQKDVVTLLDALDSAITNYKIQLQLLIGAEPTGILELAPLPELTDEEFQFYDQEADLNTAKAASWTLRCAEIALEDAREDWKDAQTDYAGTSYQYNMAEHAWKAAQLQYASAMQEFETAFQSLDRAIGDCRRELKNKQYVVEYQQNRLMTAEQQYALGRISRYALLNIQDELDTARSDMILAGLELFTARNRYQSAVQYGII